MAISNLLIHSIWAKNRPPSLNSIWSASRVSISRRSSIKLTIKTQNTLKTWLVNTLYNYNCYNLDKKFQSQSNLTNPKVNLVLLTSSLVREQPKVFTNKSHSWASQIWSRCTSISFTRVSTFCQMIEFLVSSKITKRPKTRKERRRKKELSCKWWWRRQEAATLPRRTSLLTTRWLTNPRTTFAPKMAMIWVKMTK